MPTDNHTLASLISVTKQSIKKDYAPSELRLHEFELRSHVGFKVKFYH